MKKSIILSAVLVLTVSCMDSASIETVEVAKIEECVSMESSYLIPVDEALSALDRILIHIDLPTRGYCRRVGKVATITKERMFGTSSRYANNVPEGDVLYVVNFENESGYAILGANSKLDTVLVIGDLGKFDESVFDDNNDDGKYLPDSLRVSYADLYCEEDDEYYLGSRDIGNITGDIVKDFIRIRTDFHDDEYLDDGGGAAIINPLLRTLWHQDAPFNLNFHFAPASDTDHPGRRPAGCTTIAAAQIITCMKNLDLKDKFGIIDSSWIDIEEVSLRDLLGLEPGTHDTASMIKQMADGIGVKYNFLASGGTFATPQKVKKYLERLGYDVTKYLGCKERISNKIVNSLSFGRPVFIGALASNLEGHAWVMDGYKTGTDKPLFVHCNFGWGGNANGWYLYSVFNATDGTRILDEGVGTGEEFKYSWWYRTLIIN